MLWNFVESRVSFWTAVPYINQKRAELLWKPTQFQTQLGLWKEVKNKKAYSHYGICAWQCIIYTVQNIYIKTLKQSRKCVREPNQGILAHNAVGWWDINEQGMCPKIIKDIVYVLHFPAKRKKKYHMIYQSI